MCVGIGVIFADGLELEAGVCGAFPVNIGSVGRVVACVEGAAVIARDVVIGTNGRENLVASLLPKSPPSVINTPFDVTL